MKVFCSLLVAWVTVAVEAMYVLALMWAMPKAPNWMVKVSDTGLVAYREPIQFMFAMIGLLIFVSAVVLICRILDAKDN